MTSNERSGRTSNPGRTRSQIDLSHVELAVTRTACCQPLKKRDQNGVRLDLSTASVVNDELFCVHDTLRANDHARLRGVIVFNPSRLAARVEVAVDVAENHAELLNELV